MKVILPITITDAILTSSNIAEPYSGSPTADPAAWSISTAYAVGATAYIASTHKIYQALSAITGGDSPEVSVTRVIPKWVEVGYTNRWAMFDTLRSTGTQTTTSPITITLTPGVSINSIALLGLSNITSVVISATSGGTTVYSNTFNTVTRDTNSWYTYFFGAFYFKSAVVMFDIPSQYSNLVITITFNGTATMGVGAVVLGNAITIGKTLRGATADALNFSTVTRDIFGNATLVQRRSVPKTSQQVYLDKSKLATVLSAKETLDAVPAVWSGLDDDINNDYFNPLLILGFYRSFDIEINNPIGPLATIELEEV